MEQLMVPGHISYLDSVSGAVAHRFRENYKASSTDMPSVPILKPMKDSQKIFPRSLQRLLQKDDSWVSEAQFHPPLSLPLCLPLDDENGVEKAARQSVDDLDDVYNMRYASTLTFRSPTLDQYVKPFVTTLDAKSTLTQAPMSVTSIMHCGALLPLESLALVSSSEIHLLTGIRVYVVYPPTPHNITVIEKYYTDLSQGHRPDDAGVYDALQGGIAFIQRPGQIATIPPYCPTVVFAIETSAAVTFRARCKDGLLLRLKHPDLLVSQVAAAQHRREEPVDVPMEYHLIQLYKDLGTVLKALDPNESDHDFVSQLGVAWRQNYSTFRTLVESYVSEETKNRVLGNVSKLWNVAIRYQELGKCPACDGNISDFGLAFIAHFQEEHWQQVLGKDATEGESNDAAGLKRSLPSPSGDEVNEQENGNKRARLDSS